MAYDFKKEFRELYRPSGKPSVVTVPPMSCVSSRGFEQKEHRKLNSLSIGSAHAF